MSDEVARLRAFARGLRASWRSRGRLSELNAELEERVRARTAELDAVSAQLAEERARLAAVLDQLPVGVAIAEAPSGRILRGNLQARKLMSHPVAEGLTPEQYSIRQGFHPDGRPYAVEEWPLARSILHGEVVSGEVIESVRDDGETAILAVSSAPIRDDTGRIVAGVVTFRDVSDREHRERAQREFTDNAAHELRTPLTAIASAVEVLQAGAKEQPEERDLFLGHIERECDRLARLSRALLTLARAQAQLEEPRVELVPLLPLLTGIAAALHPARSVTVEVDCADDLAVLTNRELIEQALVNLAGNAAAYTDRGSIVIRARADGQESVVVEVSDTGRGLSREEQTRIFDRFYRGPERTREGFGLGLAIASQAVGALGSTLEVESTPGVGTRMWTALPIAELVTT